MAWSFRQPQKGGWAANYVAFFSDRYQYDTIGATLRFACRSRCSASLLAVPIALRVRLMRRQRLLTTALVVPITLGTVLVAEGLLNYLGPQGWFNRTLLALHLDRAAGPPDPQLLGRLRLPDDHRLSVHVPADSVLPVGYRPGARTGGRDARRRSAPALPPCAPAPAGAGLVINFCLSFVQSFSVFPSAVLVGAPAGETRVISIAAYQAAFERFDYSMGSAIAIIMAMVQLDRGAASCSGCAPLFYRGATSGGKGADPRHLARRQGSGPSPIQVLVGLSADQHRGDDRGGGHQFLRDALAPVLAAGGAHHALVRRRMARVPARRRARRHLRDRRSPSCCSRA